MSLSPCVVRIGTGVLSALISVTLVHATETTYTYDEVGNLIGVSGCTPTTCAAQGNHCGSIPDGCGGTIWCTCEAGQVCNTSSVCVAAPVLSLSTTSLTFTGLSGGSSPVAQTLIVANGGGSTLAVPSASISYGSGYGWLNTNVSGSAAPYIVNVAPNISGLSAGTYTATISVNSAGATNSPQAVTVTLTVSAGSTASGPAVDSGFPIYANGSPGITSISSPVFSTAAGRKLVAVVMGGLITDHLVETVTSVVGGGLTWTREVFANYSNGKNDLVEIWSAWTDVALSGVQVTATFADNGNGSLDPSIVVYSISGAQAASGVTGRASAGHYDDTPGGGLQSVALSGVAAGSLVIAGATDWWANNTSFSPFPGATIDYHWMPVGVSSLWSLHATAPSAGSFTIGTSSASTQTEWQMVALEIKGGSNGIPPNPPTSPNAIGLSSSSILLTWTASTNVTSYKVESAPDIGGFAGVWTEIAPGVTETIFADMNLSASTTYWYRVRATNAYGDSDYSQEVSATTTAGDGTTKTFGRTTESTNWTAFPPNPGSISVSRFTLAENASVIKLSVIFNAAASGHFKGVIYRAGAVNTPTTLVASTSEITSLAVGTNDLPFTIPVSLTPGDYYLGVWGDQGASVNAQGGTGDNVWYGLPYTGTAPAIWDTATQSVSQNEKPIYATYYATSGGGTAKAFGKTTAGSVTERLFPVEAGGITVCKFALTESGLVSKLTVQWFWGNTTAHTRGVIYTSSGASSAGALIAQTNEVVGMDGSTNGGWQDLVFATPVSLTPGDYYLGVISDTVGASTGDETGDNLWIGGTYAAGQNAPAVFPSSPGTSTYQRAIYATYTTP